jgi:CBS domain-containing protein
MPAAIPDVPTVARHSSKQPYTFARDSRIVSAGGAGLCKSRQSPVANRGRRAGRSRGRRRDVNKLAEILAEKGHSVLQIEADASVFEAVEMMVEANVGSLLVTEGGEISGIITERDYLRRVALEGRADKETAIREIMSSPLIVGTPQTTIDQCMALMTDQRIRHVPVVDGGVVVGIVSIGDIVKFKSRQQSVEIQYLHEYMGRS